MKSLHAIFCSSLPSKEGSERTDSLGVYRPQNIWLKTNVEILCLKDQELVLVGGGLAHGGRPVGLPRIESTTGLPP